MEVSTLSYLHVCVWILSHDIQLNSSAVHIWFGEFATLYSVTHDTKNIQAYVSISLQSSFPVLQKF